MNVIIACAAPDIPSVSAPAVVYGNGPYSVAWSGTSPDDTYEIQESADPAFSDATTSVVTGTSRSFSHLEASSTTYDYRVRAKVMCDGAAYDSAWSLVGQTVVTPTAQCPVVRTCSVSWTPRIACYSCRCLSSEPCLGLDRTEIAERGVKPLPVVEDLDVVEQLQMSGRP